MLDGEGTDADGGGDGDAGGDDDDGAALASLCEQQLRAPTPALDGAEYDAAALRTFCLARFCAVVGGCLKQCDGWAALLDNLLERSREEAALVAEAFGEATGATGSAVTSAEAAATIHLTEAANFAAALEKAERDNARERGLQQTLSRLQELTMPPAHPAAASHDDSAAGVYGRRVRSMSPGDPAGCGGAAAATPAGVFAATGAQPLSPGRPRGHSEELPRLSRQRSAPLTPVGGEGGAAADTPATAFHLSPAMAAAAAGESPAGLALAPPFLAPTLVSRHSSAPTQLVAGAGAPPPPVDPLAASPPRGSSPLVAAEPPLALPLERARRRADRGATGAAAAAAAARPRRRRSRSVTRRRRRSCSGGRADRPWRAGRRTTTRMANISNSAL